MLREIFHIIYPKRCVHCGEVHEEKGSFCQICCLVSEFLSPERRCRRCYQIQKDSICLRCYQKRAPFQRTIVLFDAISPARALIKNIEAYRDVLASMFYVRYELSGWKKPKQIRVEKQLKTIKGTLNRFFQMENKDEGDYMLYITISISIDMRENHPIFKELLKEKVFVLSFIP